MARTRISTTVDSNLIAEARATSPTMADAQLIDSALAALLDRFRSTEIDDVYAKAYAKHPIDQPDEWGDLASFNEAAART